MNPNAEVASQAAAELIPKPFIVSGERGQNRTVNLLIKSQLLCQLSYAPTRGGLKRPNSRLTQAGLFGEAGGRDLGDIQELRWLFGRRGEAVAEHRVAEGAGNRDDAGPGSG